MTDEQLRRIYPEWDSLHETSRTIIRAQADDAQPRLEIMAEELLGLLDGRLVTFTTSDGAEIVVRAVVFPDEKLAMINAARAKLGVGDDLEPLTELPPNLLKITGPVTT